MEPAAADDDRRLRSSCEACDWESEAIDASEIRPEPETLRAAGPRTSDRLWSGRDREPRSEAVRTSVSRGRELCRPLELSLAEAAAPVAAAPAAALEEVRLAPPDLGLPFWLARRTSMARELT